MRSKGTSLDLILAVDLLMSSHKKYKSIMAASASQQPPSNIGVTTTTNAINTRVTSGSEEGRGGWLYSSMHIVLVNVYLVFLFDDPLPFLILASRLHM